MNKIENLLDYFHYYKVTENYRLQKKINSRKFIIKSGEVEINVQINSTNNGLWHLHLGVNRLYMRSFNRISRIYEIYDKTPKFYSTLYDSLRALESIKKDIGEIKNNF